MKIIHTSDVHLGSRLESHLDPERAKERRKELTLSFARLIDEGKKIGVSAIIVAGDLFDGKASRRIKDYLFDSIAAAPEITFFVLLGNHDGVDFFEGEVLPDNLKTFGGDWRSYSLGENVTVTGAEIGKLSAEELCFSLKLDENDLNIVVMHGQIGSFKEKEGIDLFALKNKNIDYLALGHLHSYKKIPLDRRGTCCYSGCLQGRGFDEIGEKGYVLLETGENVESEFIPFKGRRLYEIDVDITGMTALKEIEDGIYNAVTDLDRGSMLKVVLTGSFVSETHKDVDFLEKRLNEEFYYAIIEDKSKLAINPEKLKTDVSLKGEFIRAVFADKTLSEEEKNEIALLGLRALRGDDLGA